MAHGFQSLWWRSNLELTELGRKISTAMVWTAAKFAWIRKVQRRHVPQCPMPDNATMHPPNNWRASSRLDYCNSIFHLTSAASLQALQSILNAAARLVMRKWKYDRIIATLRDICIWPLQFIWQKCVFLSLPALGASAYIQHHSVTWLYHTPGRQSTSGPSIWNSLPSSICQSTTMRQFHKQLKTFFFCLVYRTWLSARSRDC